MPQQIPKYLETKHFSKIIEKDNLGRHESIGGHYRASKIIETKLPVVIRFTKGYNCKLTKVFGIDDKNCVLEFTGITSDSSYILYMKYSDGFARFSKGNKGIKVNI